MPWTGFIRRDYAREAARYASDLSDVEWALIAPLLPGPKPPGRPRVANLHEVVSAILYMASTGCQWRMLPKDFPPVILASVEAPDAAAFGGLDGLAVNDARRRACLPAVLLVTALRSRTATVPHRCSSPS